MNQKPTVGRIVHYTNVGDLRVFAALITAVGVSDGQPGTVAWLHIFLPTGHLDMSGVEFTSAPAGTPTARGCWSWPERS